MFHLDSSDIVYGKSYIKNIKYFKNIFKRMRIIKNI